MDPLDRLAGPASDLLSRVDDLLAEAGAPADHPIWPLLGRLRVLPGEAVTAVAALRPASLAGAGAALRGLQSGYDDAGVALATEVPWEGAGADAFSARRNALSAHLARDSESLTGRLEVMGSYLDGLAEWMAQSRAALARTLAETLGSAEAVAIVGGSARARSAASGGLPGATAAAEVGVRVLTTVAEVHDRGEAFRQRWASGLTELFFRSSTGAAARLDLTTRIGS